MPVGNGVPRHVS